MDERSWRWYLLGDKWDRPQKKDDAANNAQRPTDKPQGKTTACKAETTQPCSENKKYSAKERIFWNRQVCAAWALNVITLAAACAAIVGLIYVNKSIKHADQGNIDANRAWIAPYSAEPIGKDISGAIVFEISFANVGKGPALGLNWKTESDTKPAPPKLDWSLLKFDRNQTCESLEPIPEGPVTYPPAPGEPAYIRRANSGPKVLFDAVTNRSTVVYLRGCVGYKTMGMIGHSAFCWIFDPMVPDASNKISGHANLCESGSFAE